MLSRLGLRPFGNLPVFPDVKFDDELRVMYVFPDRSPPETRDSMGLMAVELGLDRAGRPEVARPSSIENHLVVSC